MNIKFPYRHFPQAMSEPRSELARYAFGCSDKKAERIREARRALDRLRTLDGPPWTVSNYKVMARWESTLRGLGVEP